MPSKAGISSEQRFLCSVTCRMACKQTAIIHPENRPVVQRCGNQQHGRWLTAVSVWRLLHSGETIPFEAVPDLGRVSVWTPCQAVLSPACLSSGPDWVRSLLHTGTGQLQASSAASKYYFIYIPSPISQHCQFFPLQRSKKTVKGTFGDIPPV